MNNLSDEELLLFTRLLCPVFLDYRKNLDLNVEIVSRLRAHPTWQSKNSFGNTSNRKTFPELSLPPETTLVILPIRNEYYFSRLEET